MSSVCYARNFKGWRQRCKSWCCYDCGIRGDKLMIGGQDGIDYDTTGAGGAGFLILPGSLKAQKSSVFSPHKPWPFGLKLPALRLLLHSKPLKVQLAPCQPVPHLSPSLALCPLPFSRTPNRTHELHGTCHVGTHCPAQLKLASAAVMYACYQRRFPLNCIPLADIGKWSMSESRGGLVCKRIPVNKRPHRCFTSFRLLHMGSVKKGDFRSFRFGNRLSHSLNLPSLFWPTTGLECHQLYSASSSSSSSTSSFLL